MTVHKLFAYDPGQTTGWAQFDVDTDVKTARIVAWGEHDLWRGIDQQINDQLTGSVVFEMIIPRHISFNPIGLRVIGVIQYLSECRKLPAVHQMNSQIQGVFMWGDYDELFASIRSEHSKDALAHGIVYLRRAGYEIAWKK